MVHHAVCKYRPISDTTPTVGRVSVGRAGCVCHYRSCGRVGLSRFAHFPSALREPAADVFPNVDHLTSRQANFETVLSLLSSSFVPESDDTLLKWIENALDNKKLRADMVRWRREWRVLVEKGEHTKALL